MDIKDLRKDYLKYTLSEDSVPQSPIDLFKEWFDNALVHDEEANAMAISTVEGNMPTTRIVLLKEVLEGKFIFFTNYQSTKGSAINTNPNVSLLFFWKSLEQQIRIRGKAVKTSSKYSDDYFYSRPIESQAGAIASAQSRPLQKREDLENKIVELLNNQNQVPLKRPDHWGGYAIEPTSLEFWQGRASRLHDRIQYVKENDVWTIKRLNP